ncbi:ATP-binding protein [Arthrobacter sp. YD2]|uniref:ATP-binding protein n=1 Tax=Arthrobacter sp. YD2 TaxID=3058046 RepID=UPI0025B384BA|nr:ATP-binding protein [Arthrobacter sp. YD2]MDN3902920.1 ATP-binding protein [Arthrobacter sp. YD2]
MDGISEELIASLRRAVTAAPEDTALRLHLAQLLLDGNRAVEALGQINTVLGSEPASASALALLNRAAAALSSTVPDGAASDVAPAPDASAPDVAPAPETPAPDAGSDDRPDFDWERAESDIDSTLPPPFVEPGRISMGEDGEPVAITEPEVPALTLADVGGLEPVKQRLNESFLVPMRHADVAKTFRKSLRGGLLLYGPPGCGKTFLARAVAGELGAAFMSVSITDVVDPLIGQTEKNLKAIFDSARAHQPTVLFIDEVDAIGLKRSSMVGSSVWLRQMVNQLLLELDSMSGDNDGLYVLAATNHPWDLDEALMRPGRLDRAVLVIPPDPAARRAILNHNLKDRPLAGINLEEIVGRTDGFSGADLAHLCTTAAEKAMMRSIEANEIRPVTMEHINLAFAEVRPSTLPWLESAVNVVKFSNRHGRYNDLAEYLRARQML